MHYLDLTLPTPAENLAGDEALLETSETGVGHESLRFWQPRQYFVVLGYANGAEREVDWEACRAAGVPVYRRISGGGTVLQGPGCLNYNLILKIEHSTPLAGITDTNRFIMERHAAALTAVVNRPVRVQGFTDLTVHDLKFSGNSQRRKRRFLMFHGTFLLDFDLDLMERLLRFPSHQPDYRQDRAHRAFLTNLQVPADTRKSSSHKILAGRRGLAGTAGELH